MTCVFVCVSACKSKWFPMTYNCIGPEKPFKNRKCCGREMLARDWRSSRDDADEGGASREHDTWCTSPG